MGENRLITAYQMPIINGYPQLNSYPAEFILNQVLTQTHPASSQPVMTSDERREQQNIKREILTDPSHLFGIEARRTQLNTWSMTSWLYCDRYPELPENVTEGFDERQMISILMMYQENTISCQRFYERSGVIQPVRGLKESLDKMQSAGQLPYILRTNRLYLPPIIPSRDPAKVERQLQDHFTPIEEKYEQHHLHKMTCAQMGRDGVKNCFKVKHPLEFIAVHAPRYPRFEKAQPERRLVFAMTPFDARLIAAAKTDAASILALQTLNRTYILPYIDHDPDYARLNGLDALHYDRWRLQAYRMQKQVPN